jgi:hypothetical protein
MSNTINVASTASDIIEALSEAKNIKADAREKGAEAKQRAENSTLTGYAIAAVAIRTMLDTGNWTTGKQKGGIVSASVALKDALVTEAKAKEISPGSAKRLIEKAAALVVPGSKVHVSAVHVAAAQSTGEVMKALRSSGLNTEADIVRHVEPPMPDIVGRLMKAISKLKDKDRSSFVRELVSHEIIDDVLEEANKTTPAEREAARMDAEKAAKATKAASTTKAALAKRREEKETKATTSKVAKPSPKGAGSKKGAMTKAKKGEVADPFAS